MSGVLGQPFSINGVISTDRNVLQNINTLCDACGAFMSYDISDGKWAVVINKAETTAVASFDDSTIIGSINVSSTGITELYNAVKIEFPHVDLRDQTDSIELSIDSSQLYANEITNTLNMRIDCINNPVQAQYLATVELKQSRVDKVIQFRTDYSYLGLKAGDVISVTNSVYGFTDKFFRITRIDENDDDVLSITITALEYSADVYSTSGLVRKERTRATGIIPKRTNANIKAVENQSSLKMEVTPSALAQGLSLFYVGAAGYDGLTNGTWYLDTAGQKVTIDASDVVITWTFGNPNFVNKGQYQQNTQYFVNDFIIFENPDSSLSYYTCKLAHTSPSSGITLANWEAYDQSFGLDLDIRCRLFSPQVGQTSVDNYLGYTGEPSTYVWPPSTTTGSGGTAYLEWGGDNTGVGTESVRVDIDRIKTVYPDKRYIVVECRGNWYVARGQKPVQLLGVLYQGGTTTRQESPLGSATGPFGFTNTGATNSRELSSVGVYVDSLTDPSGPSNPGASVLGDLMGYFIYDTVTFEGQFVQQLPPGYTD